LLVAGACGAAPATRGGSDEGAGAVEAVEQSDEAEEEAEPVAAPGAWAPEGSLANVEDVPVEGRVEVRESLSVGDRIVLTVPIAPEGNALLEIAALPREERERLIVAVRTVQEGATFAGCTELVLESDGAVHPLTDPTHSPGPSALGRAEAVRGLASVATVTSLATAERIRIRACGQEYFVPTPARPQIAEFLRLFTQHE